jgi:hypothetical protein
MSGNFSGRYVMVDMDKALLTRLGFAFLGMPGAMEKVIATTINKTAMSAKKDVASDIARRYKVSQEKVNDSIKVDRATSKKPRAGIWLTRGRINVIEFAKSTRVPRQRGIPVALRPPVEVEIIRGSPKNLRASNERSAAFIQRMPTGHIGVFQRKKGVKPKAPISDVRTLSAFAMGMHPEIIVKVVERAHELFDTELSAQVRKELKRWEGGT